uniref:Uncharacterized protein n=1 Tax=Chelydra serpentina TaxID=8475 RepID=A0A8C3SGB9_CHESE
FLMSVAAHARPVRELQAEGGHLQPDIVRTFNTSELQEIVKTFRQEPGEGVLRWLVRAWYNAGNMVMLLWYELQLLGVLSQDSQVRAQLSPSLYRWLAAAVSAAYTSVGELEALAGPWQTIAKGVQILRQLGMAWAVETGGTEGPDDILVTKSIKATLLRLAPDELKSSLLAVVMAADGRVRDLALRVPRKTLWLDLLKAGVPREEINGKPTAILYKWWMQLPASKRSTGGKGERGVEQSKPTAPPTHLLSGSCRAPIEGMAGPPFRADIPCLR